MHARTQTHTHTHAHIHTHTHTHAHVHVHAHAHSCTSTHTEVPGIWMVETMDSSRSAQALNERWGQRRERDDSDPLRVMVQVNTSGEESECY